MACLVDHPESGAPRVVDRLDRFALRKLLLFQHQIRSLEMKDTHSRPRALQSWEHISRTLRAVRAYLDRLLLCQSARLSVSASRSSKGGKWAEHRRN